MKQPLQKFEFATSILRFAKDHGIPMETVKEAIELLHRDICGTPSTVAAVNEDKQNHLPKLSSVELGKVMAPNTLNLLNRSNTSNSE